MKQSAQTILKTGELSGRGNAIILKPNMWAEHQSGIDRLRERMRRIGYGKFSQLAVGLTYQCKLIRSKYMFVTICTVPDGSDAPPSHWLETYQELAYHNNRASGWTDEHIIITLREFYHTEYEHLIDRLEKGKCYLYLDPKGLWLMTDSYLKDSPMMRQRIEQSLKNQKRLKRANFFLPLVERMLKMKKVSYDQIQPVMIDDMIKYQMISNDKRSWHRLIDLIKM